MRDMASLIAERDAAIAERDLALAERIKKFDLQAALDYAVEQKLTTNRHQ